MKNLKLLRKILTHINLEREIDDFETIHKAIEKDIVFKGTNLWILVFAIVIASVGLNMNSTAVIIGAMLISPLMGPINGMGYSIATYNFPLLRQAIKNFTFAVIVSLIASTMYFTISPIYSAHSELLARTSPTIYDVIIALFGGLAGIVAISSKQKGNVIPGVAIATALMPPLCTAGFGLASGQFNYFFGAFYLFTINTVFIALSSVLISQILKFPIRTIVEEVHKKKVNRWISIISTLIIIPSIYFGYKLVQNEKFADFANKYVQSISVLEGSYLLKNEIVPDERTISLIYGGNLLNEETKKSIANRAKDFNLEDAKINFQQGFSTNQLDKNVSEVEHLKSEINRLNNSISLNQKFLDTLKLKENFGRVLLSEINAIYPQITSCTYFETPIHKIENFDSTKINVVILTAEKKYKFNKDIQSKIKEWLKTRLNTEKIQLIIE
ncbi:MAG: DUF389 domain-containing protein [Ignavibacteriales bacterium]|nr:DUF389 domain-containing protein [Ignavibacteriales bacterium]